MTIPADALTIVEEFKQDLIADGKSPATIESYVGDIIGFLAYLVDKDLHFKGEMKRYQITNYRKYLVDHDYAINTIAKKINSLLSFNYYLVKTKRMIEIVVHRRKDQVKLAAGSEREIPVFSEEEIERVLLYLNDSDKVTDRDRLIVLLLLYTGIRVSELVGIRLKDIDILAMNLRIVSGKGTKARDVPLKAEVIEILQAYLSNERKQNKHADSPYLLLTQRSGKMDRDAVNRVLSRLGDALGIPMHPHKFRHTFCTRLIKRGVDLTTVSKLAGHAGIQTTAKFYISTSRQDKQDAVNIL